MAAHQLTGIASGIGVDALPSSNHWNRCVIAGCGKSWHSRQNKSTLTPLPPSPRCGEVEAGATGDMVWSAVMLAGDGRRSVQSGEVTSPRKTPSTNSPQEIPIQHHANEIQESGRAIAKAVFWRCYGKPTRRSAKKSPQQMPGCAGALTLAGPGAELVLKTDTRWHSLLRRYEKKCIE